MFRPIIRTLNQSMKPVILSSRFNDLAGLPVRFRPIVEERFDVIEVDQYQALPDAYNDQIVGVLTYEDMEHFGDKTKNTRLFDQLPNLKVVSTVSAGYDHLDIDYLHQRQIRIGHTPRQVAAATADQAMALMLAGARNLYRGARGTWVNAYKSKTIQPRLTDMMASSAAPTRNVNDFGVHFTGATVGIVGLGNIGLKIAERAHFGFDCRILYHNRRERTDVDHVKAVYFDKLNEMLPECDFICVVANLTDQTRNMIGDEQFKLMKKEATFCNVSRGGTVDQNALLSCLRRDGLHAVAVDVTEPEPLPRGHPLVTGAFERLIVTPHWGTATESTVLAMTRAALDNIWHAIHDETMIAEVSV